MCSNAFASSRLKRPGFASTVLSWTRVRPFVRVIVFLAPIGVPGHSGEVASGADGNVYRSFFSAIATNAHSPDESRPILGASFVPRCHAGAMAARRGATVELREVTKRYGETVAVDRLSFTAPAGRICVLIGPSSCGKTTSLRMVNRLIEPTSGEILIDGENVLREDPTQLRRRIGYVIQQVGLFPHGTSGQNVASVPEVLW